jgi:hypothetical protein
MEDRSQTNTLLLIIAGVLLAGAAYFYYDKYIEPKNDGPMERAGEKLDNAIDGK